MTYEERLKNVSVLGAAGKMGSGILLLTAIEMADLALQTENKDKPFILNAIDVSPDGLAGLMRYMKEQVRKVAEKKAVWLRKMYADRDDLIENCEIIDEYIFDVMNIVRPSTSMEVAYHSSLIFEAIVENKDVKVKLFSQIKENTTNNPWFFTNTSSIPIRILEKEAGLQGKIIGFHFYNPPAVQKLVELITTANTKEEVKEFAQEYAGKLKKVIVPSNDYAGFIGNGHFMRDAIHGMNEAEALAKEKNIPLYQAIYMINKVTQDYLVRPMGIFQLIDYVGIDVVSFIMSVMNPHHPDEEISHHLLDKMIEQGVKGGQYSNGAQKDGFIKYSGGKPAAFWDISNQEYIDVEKFQELCDQMLGKMPESAVSWKSMLKAKNKEELIGRFVSDLKSTDTLGARLSVKYGKRSKEIGEQLVERTVALNHMDVNTVMLTGFFHAYGPVNTYFD